MSVLSISAEFSVGWPLLPAYNFWATMASSYSSFCLGAVSSLKLVAIESMPRVTLQCVLSIWWL